MPPWMAPRMLTWRASTGSAKRRADRLARLVDRAHEDLERIDEPGLAIAGRKGGRAHGLAATFHKPVAIKSVRSPATISPDRKTMVRVRRVTRTRASITIAQPARAHEIRG